MELVADGVLLVTALTSAVYCLVLSRRLRRLGSTDDGIGQQIQALGSAIEETRGALSQTQDRLDAMRREANASGERMAREGARAKRLSDDLAAAVMAAERTLDTLYLAEKRVGGGAQPTTERPRFEIAEAPPVDLGGVDDGSKAPPSCSGTWQGEDVLRVERMSL